MQKLRQLSNAVVVLVVAYVVLPFPLAYLPATSHLSQSWKGELKKEFFDLLNLAKEMIPDLLVIGLILMIVVGILRAINAWFSAVR